MKTWKQFTFWLLPIIFGVVVFFIACDDGNENSNVNNDNYDNTSPVILSAKIYNLFPNKIHIEFSKSVIITSVEDFILIGNTTLEIRNFTEGLNDKEYIFILSRDVIRREKIFLKYLQSEHPIINDLDNNALKTIDILQVANGIDAYDATNGFDNFVQYINEHANLSSKNDPALILIVNSGTIDPVVNKIISDKIFTEKKYVILDYSCGGNGFENNAVTYQTMADNIKDNEYILEIILPLNVVSIEVGAFSNCIYLTNIILNDRIINIGENAFSYCNNLKTINLPSNITSINSHTFYSCRALENIIIPDNVTRIEWNAFNGCSKIESIIIPDNVTVIEDMVFSGCNKLSYVKLPSSLKTIKAGAFANCTSLQSINLPLGLETIGGLGATTNGPFSYSGLLKLEVPSTVAYIGDDAFSDTPLNTVTIYSTTFLESNPFSDCKNIIFNIIGENSLNAILDNKALIQNISNVSTLICMPLASGVIIIPSGINKIGNRAFSNNTSLTEIILPDTVISIGDFAFQNCSNLNSITLSNNLENIGRYAFSRCSLSSIIFPATLKIIDDYSFEYNDGITNLIFPQNLQNINYYAFGNCFYISQVTLLNSTTRIDPNAFWTCSLYLPYNRGGAGIYVRDVPNGTTWAKIEV